MPRLVVTSFGDPLESVELLDDPGLAVGPDEVLVEMQAAVLNASDLLLVRGFYGVRPELPSPLGGEGVGRVVECGSEVPPELTGRRVMIMPTYEQGTWADRVVVKQRNVVPVSEDGDLLQQAMLAVNPATADVMLRLEPLKPGDWIAQNAANSAVGQYVIALAKRQGLHTLNIVRRPEAADVVTAAGGDVVLLEDDDELRKKIATALGKDKLSLLLDAAGGPALSRVANFLKPGSKVVTYAGIPSRNPAVLAVDLIFKRISVTGFWLMHWMREAPRAEIDEMYDRLGALVASGELRVPIEATYRLAGYRDAFRHAMAGKTAGKILFTFG
ncbi:zinc-dependent alcohol dehydrogenase family protein [Actinocrispum sp. NPDC049592]|uniref:zinc-dependent alcohol dehydrogenase family protein n=1 Tax=Actinocrispum sp. NPDC049592 TaxID=3154835 RepID=UPI0034402A00